MNLGVRLHDVEGKNLEERLARAKALGFTCVHLAMSKVIEGFSMQDAPALLTEALAAEVRGLAEKYQLQVAVLGCYLNLATPDSDELAWTTACYLAHLRFAKWMGALVVGTETGAPNAQYRTTPECFTEESLALFIQRLRPVVEEAERLRMPVAIEPVCRHIVSTPQRTRAVLDALHSPALSVILDPVNLLDSRNHQNQRQLFEQSVSLLGDWIRVVHWKDYILRDEELVAAAGGQGEVQADSVLAFLAKNPQMPVTLEDTNAETVEAARDDLRAKLLAAGSR